MCIPLRSLPSSSLSRVSGVAYREPCLACLSKHGAPAVWLLRTLQSVPPPCPLAFAVLLPGGAGHIFRFCVIHLLRYPYLHASMLKRVREGTSPGPTARELFLLEGFREALPCGHTRCDSEKLYSALPTTSQSNVGLFISPIPSVGMARQPSSAATRTPRNGCAPTPPGACRSLPATRPSPPGLASVRHLGHGSTLSLSVRHASAQHLPDTHTGLFSNNLAKQH